MKLKIEEVHKTVEVIREIKYEIELKETSDGVMVVIDDYPVCLFKKDGTLRLIKQSSLRGLKLDINDCIKTIAG